MAALYVIMRFFYVLPSLKLSWQFSVSINSVRKVGLRRLLKKSVQVDPENNILNKTTLL